MITCPWCGTHYLAFQPNCQNCGGPLQPVEEQTASTSPNDAIPIPPPAPRPVPKSYVWRLLYTDGWSIGAFILGLVGFIFSLVGAGLTAGIITAFVGIPFLLLGLALLGAGIWVFIWRYQNALKVVNVLREGETVRGQIIELRENYAVSINGRHPWVIRYQFQAAGQEHEGKVTILDQPRKEYQEGKAVCVLYLPLAPQWSSIYPHP
jgi:Protein of unknown function (DUF3592)